MSSAKSPCAACKILRQKCTQECVLAPYFPPDNPQKFATVHKVFGKSNVAKILNELSVSQREEAVNSLSYEAEYRLRDPVYGCVGLISILQQRLKQLQYDLHFAKKELATFVPPHHQGLLPIFTQMPPPILPQDVGIGHSISPSCSSSSGAMPLMGISSDPNRFEGTGSSFDNPSYQIQSRDHDPHVHGDRSFNQALVLPQPQQGQQAHQSQQQRSGRHEDRSFDSC
ncbi:hypothetical protein COLO4_37818 [Corchorus olitorius]|uniref:LOB domain-containing protein n=1 Tax=Corchorus olitorius TaxID=93759 RepID=A0A1R3FZ49_9ROSI|nr:hypothetical protein COLO4_37818 [Corchorus olitorius]